MQKSVSGYTTERFASFKDLFDVILKESNPGGASVAIFHDGKQVVDLYGGISSPESLWDTSTLSLAFSCTKGVTSLVLAQLVEKGMIDPDSPVAHYWPEFTSISDALTVREMMGHKSGLASLKQDLTLDEVLDHNLATSKFMEQGPLWESGTNHAYHAFSFGNLVQELVFRVTGHSVSDLFQEHIAVPLNLDAWIGIPSSEEHRVALLQAETPALEKLPELGSSEDLQQRALSFGKAFPLTEPFLPGKGFNDTKTHQAQLPGVNLITNATALAKIWSATVTETDGIRLINDGTVDLITTPVSTGQSFWGEAGPWPSRGFGVMLNTPERNPLTSVRSFGHEGLGGQVGFADPENNVGFAFLTNNLQFGEKEHARWSLLVSELKTILAS